ncbi:hypothetical protein A33M_2301 [Rhodovulum sp. PH10]|nr:hypothetical protein A33M_2301 [Rhodovulum sp. PH10]
MIPPRPRLPALRHDTPAHRGTGCCTVADALRNRGRAARLPVHPRPRERKLG